jgi:hypothetical protein
MADESGPSASDLARPASSRVRDRDEPLPAQIADSVRRDVTIQRVIGRLFR